MTESELSIRQNLKNKNEDCYPIKVYFYDGTSEPEIVAKIKDKESLMESNFANTEYLKLKNYYVDPTTKDFQRENIRRYGLSMNKNLEEFNKDNVVHHSTQHITQNKIMKR
ncbi:hypothetical protein [Lactococcus lactis]|uniref:hypothetical protein n=1 Tax=Lactococcus lactis TaxID=1358 RepID=UPI0022E4EA36|nr:hypothetical protein [Lactococcus lactis]